MTLNTPFKPAKLAELRAYNGYSQASLARAVKLSRSQICRLESGDSVPSLGTAVKIAKELGVPLSVLTESDSCETRFFHSGELDHWVDIHRFMRNANRIVTVTRKINSCLQTDSMLPILNPWCFEKKSVRQKFLRYVQEQRATFFGSRFLQLLVFPRELFSVLRVTERQWLTDFLNQLKNLGRPTYFLPVNNYLDLVTKASQQLPSRFEGWDKATVIDDFLVVFHYFQSAGADAAVCFERSIARGMVDEAMKHLAVHGVVTRNEPSKWKLKEGCLNHERNRDLIEHVLRIPPPFIDQTTRALYPILTKDISTD